MLENKDKKIASKEGYVIGVGASAGGIDVLKVFFSRLPKEVPHSFVIVQHLSSDYKSLMADLLKKHTSLPIHTVEQGMKLEKGHIYLIPSGKNLSIKKDCFELSQKPDKSKINFPIDIFFDSLAQNYKSKAIAVVLSGTGSDGSRGIKKIKENGGFVITQSPETSQFDGMPHASISTGFVDTILAPEDMPEQIMRYIRSPKVELTQFERNVIKDRQNFNKILELISDFANINFSWYKKPTLIRRLARRMHLNHCETLSQYYKFVLSSAQELSDLVNELFIGVTSFFRDSSAFSYLQKNVVRELVRNCPVDQSIKVWSIACSTGEEAYSTAILFKEAMEELRVFRELKIFATDVSKEAIEKAGMGSFDKKAISRVSNERLKKFFYYKKGEYTINFDIRQCIIFAQHNALNNPPFKNVDLIICRNFLIYLEPSFQKKMINIIHYSLKEKGYLFLGPSESLGEFSSQFTVLNRKWKIYKNKILSSGLISESLQFTPSIQTSQLYPKTNWQISKEGGMERQFASNLNDILCSQFGAAAIYVDKNFDILYGIGNYKKYLNMPDHYISFNLLHMLPKEASLALSTTSRKVLKTGEKVICKSIPFEQEEVSSRVDILLCPANLSKGTLNVFQLVVFLESQVSDTSQMFLPTNNSNEENSFVGILETELRDTKENMRTILEELETSNEEHQATNEELLAANEELQSTNEELQSVNEELHSVNTEHQLKIEELSILNSDMENLITSTQIGTIFLTNDFRIRKFTPAIKEQLTLLDGDVGRPIHHFTSHFVDDDNKKFLKHLHSVVKNRVPIKDELQTKDGSWYLSQFFPFMRNSNVQDGAVVSFVDINEIKETRKQLELQRQVLIQRNKELEHSTKALMDSEETFRSIFASAPEGILIADDKGKIVRYNQTLADMMGYDTSELIGKEVEVLIPPELRKGHVKYRKDFQKNEKNNREMGAGRDLNAVRKNGELFPVEIGLAPFEATGKKFVSALVVDITERKKVEQKLHKQHQDLLRINKELEQFAYSTSHDLRSPLKTIQGLSEAISEELEDNEIELAKQYNSKIEQNAIRLDNLIIDIFEYTKASSDSEEMAPVNFKSLIKEIVTNGLASYDNNTVQLKTNFNHRSKFKSQNVRIYQILSNLISNGIKYSNPKSKSQYVEISTRDLPKNQLEIVVRDNGIGIPKDSQDKVFSMFFRANSVEKSGTGLGLSLVKKHVDSLKGKIDFKSNTRGTEFRVTLPNAV